MTGDSTTPTTAQTDNRTDVIKTNDDARPPVEAFADVFDESVEEARTRVWADTGARDWGDLR